MRLHVENLKGPTLKAHIFNQKESKRERKLEFRKKREKGGKMEGLNWK